MPMEIKDLLMGETDMKHYSSPRVFNDYLAQA